MRFSWWCGNIWSIAGHDSMLTHILLLTFQVSLLPLFSEQMKKNKMLEVALYQESRLANTGSGPV
jgi:hypothetical protein